MNFMQNVIALVKAEKVAVGVFENKMGVCKGYCSRKIKDPSGLSLEVAIKMAEFVGESIDDLLHKDYVKPCEKRLIQEQINELQKKLRNIDAAEDDLK